MTLIPLLMLLLFHAFFLFVIVVQIDAHQSVFKKFDLSAMEAIGHMAIVYNHVYVTTAILEREHVVHDPFVLHPGASMYLPPGAIVQITSAVAGSFILAPFRSGIWQISGGPQSLITFMMHYFAFFSDSMADIRAILDHASKEGRRSLKTQLPIEPMQNLLRAPDVPVPSMYSDVVASEEAQQYSKDLIAFARHLLDLYARHFNGGRSPDDQEWIKISEMTDALKVQTK